jgi:hypothetical protein
MSAKRSSVVAKMFQMLSHRDQYPWGERVMKDLIEKCTTLSEDEVRESVAGLADWSDEKLDSIA